MKILLVSYSMTGNNETLANGIADELAADRLRITEPGSRTVGKIAFDVMLNRTPKIDQNIDGIENNDLVVFVGPVWMGKAASPLRPCLNHLKGKVCDYAFISISGGADGPNPSLEDDLTKRVGKAPKAVIDLHIADLLPSDPKPQRKDTMKYRLNEPDTKDLTNLAMKALRGCMDLKNIGSYGSFFEERRTFATASPKRRHC